MDESVVSNSCDISSGNSILYELLVYLEWKQDPELPKLLPDHEEGFRSLLRSVWSNRQQDGRSNHVERLLSWQQPWRLCVGDGGKVVAILQEASLEIRSSRDEYSSVIAKASLPKDPFPQWRRWCWSPDCTMLAIGFSNGAVRVYDLMGSILFSIIPPSSHQEQSFTDTSSSYASCFFLQARTTSQKWSSELITVDYNGQLRSYLVSPTEGFQENHTFSLGNFYRLGITSVAYHPAHSLLFVGGPVASKGTLQLQESGEKAGLTTWRILNDHPFYQIVQQDKKGDGASFSDSFLRIPFIGSKYPQSVVIRLEVSPSANRIAALHSCGGVSIWSLPGVRLLGFWPLTEQPDWNAQNPLNIEAESPNGKRPAVNHSFLANESYYPIDLDWWSDEALVLVRNSGAVSVCEVSSLLNLLGESPEFLSGSAQVRRLHNEKGFLALECDVDVFSKSRNSDETLEEDSTLDLSDDASENEEPTTLFYRVVTVLNSVAYLVTDMERFRPKRRRLRLCRRTYRFLALRSTTPEELYSRKLDNEEYGEALTLAHTYNLDCDLVYQRQWRNNKVSIATIRDYLGKVSNQTWVLRECLARVPESLLAARELIEFGLKATSKEAFRTLGSKRKIKSEEDMTEKQKEFLIFRHTLLRYQDRLTMYEKILGGLQLADELFEHTVYAEFRSSSSLRACVQFARAANCRAVECMLTYQGSQTLHHWLPILSNFPETVCPTEYKSLLPEITPEGVVFSWQESQLRQLDWSEKDVYGNIEGFELDTPNKDNKWLYEHEPGLSTYRIPMKELTPKLIQQWYMDRIRAIERSSRMVDNALLLLRLAQDNNIEGLQNLHQELQVLDALVYELFLEDVSLSDLEKKSILEKCKLLMSKTTEESFIVDVSRLLVPYLERVEKDQPGSKVQLLHDYIVSLSTESLLLTLKIFEGQEELTSGLSPDELSAIAVDSIYAYGGTDHLHLAQSILAAIPVQRVLSLANTEQLDALELELAASLILHRNGCPKSLGYIRDNKNDVETVTQLLTRVARTVAYSNTSLSEDMWSTLFNDILDLHRSVFSCVPLPKCYEVFCSTLLASGHLASIRLAGNYFNSSVVTRDDYSLNPDCRLSREKCVQLVLFAAREYMDSAGSLIDPALELAKTCLYLLQTEDEDIQEEKNLLSAFQSLHEFGIKLLPVQVRLCPDKLRLIDECLKKKTGAHRNPSKLLRLAAHLNINSDNSNERHGRVLILIAESAYLTNDFSSCAETCNRLIAANYTNAWVVASKLAKCTQFKDLSMRTQLLSFALQHCPHDMLQELVNIRRSVEIESLQQVVEKQIVMHNSRLSVHLEGESPDTQSERAGMDFLQSFPRGESSVQETTQRLLSCIGDSHFWKKALRIGWDDSIEGETAETMGSRECHMNHAFYSSLYDSSSFCASKLGYQYNCFSTPDIPPQLQLEQAILRLSLLEHESGSPNPNLPNVLSECALSLLSEDHCLGLGYLLSLSESFAKGASHHIFDANISTVSLQIAQYHAALRCYQSIFGCNVNTMHNLFLYSPQEVISLATQVKCKDESWQSEIQCWRAQLADYLQAQDLLTLDCGVDITRFASDDQYRHDSILGLAMSEDAERLRFALTLAARHNVDRGQVIAEHVTSLLLSNLPHNEVKERLSGPDLSNVIQEAAEVVKEKLESSVFSNIDGKRLGLLELYFTVLNKTSPSHRTARLLPKDHLKLLSKVKATTAAIDYKLLISGPKYTLEAVEMSLSVDNIPLIAKLLKAMPTALASPLSTSQLYAVYLKHQLENVRNVSMENLAPLLVNIKSDDILDVIKGAFFCDPLSKSSISMEFTEELIATVLLNCDFSECEKHLTQLVIWKDHIRSTRHLMDIWPEDECCKDYLTTNGERDALKSLLEDTFLNEGKSVEFFADLLKTVSSVCGVTGESLLQDFLRRCVDSFQEKEEENLCKLNSALLRIEQLVLIGKLQLTSNEWESLLHPLATLEKLPPEQRLKIFNMIQQTGSDIVQEPTLIFPHTQTILASSWPEIGITNDDIEDDGKRYLLLLRLIESTELWQQRKALQNILDLWPTFSDSCNHASEIFHNLLLNSVLCEDGKWTDQKASYIIDICQRHPFSISELDQFLSEVSRKTEECNNEADESEDDDSEMQVDVQLLILVCLMSPDLKANHRAVSMAQQRLIVPFHDQLAEIAVARDLTVDLLATPAYSDLMSNVLVSQPGSVEAIVKTLIHRKHIPEAGSVILRSIHSVPRFMRTFSSAMIAGLKQTSLDSSISIGTKQRTNNEESFVTKAHSNSVVACNPQTEMDPQSDEWNAAENEWCNVEESQDLDSPSVTDVHLETESVENQSAHVETQLKSDEWNDQDGWDNWSEGENDEELEKIHSEKNVRKMLNRGNLHNKPEQISPPLLPSPQSAFARVPPREHITGAASSQLVPEQTDAKAPVPPTDEASASSGWDDEDWGEGWGD